MVTEGDYNCDGRMSINEYIAMVNRKSQGGRHEPPNCQQEVQGCHNSTRGMETSLFFSGNFADLKCRLHWIMFSSYLFDNATQKMIINRTDTGQWTVPPFHGFYEDLSCQRNMCFFPGLTQMDRSTAERAVRAAIAKSEELDVAVTIAVVDSGANLVSLVRW